MNRFSLPFALLWLDAFQNRGMGLDMNVQEAWAEGVTGKGTVVTILDDGLEKDHPDIRRNYVSALTPCLSLSFFYFLLLFLFNDLVVV